MLFNRKVSKKHLKKADKLVNETCWSNASTFHLAKLLFEDLDTPVSLGCYLRLKYGEYEALCRKEVNPREYNSADSYFCDKQATSLLKKYQGFDFDPKWRSEKTLDGFRSTEAACAETNDLLSKWDRGHLSLIHGANYAIPRIRRKISEILGKFDVEEWLDNCRFGPGAATGLPGTSDYCKLSKDPSTTELFEPYALEFLTEFPGWVNGLSYGCESGFKMKVFPGGKYSQVPKTALIDRSIETQPLLNGFGQLGLGMMMRKRLRTIGIDLDDQSNNQLLAYLGSLNGEYATMDLKDASGRNARELVRQTFPSDWLHAMSLLRTPVVRMPDGTSHVQEQWSGMGNGYTFEVETLLFWAIATLVSPWAIVYGDDIVIPSSKFTAVKGLLEVLGHKVNDRKSFDTTPFRESCGADFWDGTPVRPYFIKEVPQNVADVIALANGLRRVAGRGHFDSGFDRRFARASLYAIRRVPVSIRRLLAWGVDSSGDGVVLKKTARSGYQVVWRQKVSDPPNYWPAVATALYRVHRRRPNLKHKPTSLELAVQLVMSGAETRSRILNELHSHPYLEPSGRIFDYRRDAGIWELREHALSSFERGQLLINWV